MTDFILDGIECRALVEDGCAYDLEIRGFEPCELEPGLFAEDLPFGYGVECEAAWETARRHIRRFGWRWVEAAVAQQRADEECQVGEYADRSVSEYLAMGGE